MNTKHTNELAPMNIAGWLAELHADEAATWAATPKPVASVAVGRRGRQNIYPAVQVLVVVRQHSRRTEARILMG